MFMDLATILGLLTGTGLIITAMIIEAAGGQASLTQFWNPSSMMIVLGGTLAATAVAFRLKEVVRVFALIRFVLSKPRYVLSDLVGELIESSEIYKKNPNDLEQHLNNVKTHFIKDGLEFIAQGIKYDDLYPLTWNADNTMQNILYNFQQGRHGWKVNYVVNWDNAAYLSIIQTATKDTPPKHPLLTQAYGC